MCLWSASRIRTATFFKLSFDGTLSCFEMNGTEDVQGRAVTVVCLESSQSLSHCMGFFRW